MLDLDTRTAILRLSREGRGSRFIASALGIARDTVQKVVASGQAEVPTLERPSQLSPYIAEIRRLHLLCKGNLVRVHEELEARHGVVVSYSTLTGFCRKAEIGTPPKQAAGRYHFKPGQEMQHDTSPHTVLVGARQLPLQCASLVMCYSRRRFFQLYRRWTRFHARAFLTRALVFFDSVAEQCMVDNSTVIMTGGTGADARAVPEMAAFAERFGFSFVAHALGDANRSARVEGPFWHIENNFYPGRTFADLRDLNAQAVAWCQTYNATFHKSFKGIPDEMGVLERLASKPLPAHIPEPVEVHLRRVDTEGYLRLHTNRYSVPEALIGLQLEVHESLERVRVFSGHRLVAEHPRREDGEGVRVTISEHHSHHRRRAQAAAPSPEERALRAASPALSALCDALRRDRARGRRAILRLHRIWLDYPAEILEPVILRALDFGLFDLARIERMILKQAKGDFFRLPQEDSDG